MAAPLLSKEDFYELYKATVQAADPEHDTLTDWSEGSINDMLAGAAAVIGAELQFRTVQEFSKTLIANTETNEMDELIVDHYGESFARIGNVAAVGIVKFTRLTSAASVTISAGTVVQTTTPVGGSPISFVTDIDLTLGIGVLVGYVAVTAEEAGSAGNVSASAITNISPPMTGFTVTNDDEMAGGANTQTDPEYQAHVGDLISSIRGGTDSGIEAKLRAVPGIDKATVQTKFQSVKNWNIAGAVAEGSVYTIVRAIAYIADANGTANDALIAKATEALKLEKVAGANIDVLAASALELDWTATFVLNVSGPNFTALSADPSPILNTMREYIGNLNIGDDFIRATANTFVLAKWGPTGGGGSNDITTFTTSVPSGDVSTGSNVKLIAGDIDAN